MLSFLGPQMNSVYNACSWLDFGFTIAESMGIHRSTSALGANSMDKGRVKRLWWTLTIRDTHCAALLGRPFRINIPQCDVPMLDLDDFASELDGDNHDSALYQIEVARISIIGRSIIQRRFHSPDACMNLDNLQDDLAKWRSQVPARLLLANLNSNANIFATALELLYQQHIILLHFDYSQNLSAAQPRSIVTESSSAAMAISAAQEIASSASRLVTRGVVHQLPHEVFTGFFISGIVYHRQISSSNPLMSQAARASLDNCRMLLHEIHDAWDPAFWSIRIFDFLLTRANAQKTLGSGAQESSSAGIHATNDDSVPSGDVVAFDEGLSASFDPEDMMTNGWMGADLTIPDSFEDFLLMPNFFGQG